MKGVSVEKLEEIFKVYDEKRTGKIATNDMGKALR
jgi:Ca2+-binding EF-hand superfamily protein